jgi:hypothetical protein
MSISPTPQFDDDSIFSGSAEAPEAGANTFDDDIVPGDLEQSVDEQGRLKVTVPLGDVNLHDHSEEQKIAKERDRKLGVALPEMPATTPEAVRSPAMMQNSTDPLQDEMERRFSQGFGDLKVNVTSQDRDAFVRSALHDEELVLSIELPGVAATICVAIPPDSFTTSASAAVTQWGREDFIDKESDMQWLLAFQQVHAWYQVRSVNGEPTVWSDYWVDGLPPLKEIRKSMRDHSTFDPIFQLNAVRWRMMLDAIRIAELKYKICLQNWKDRSFFDGAGTD